MNLRQIQYQSHQQQKTQKIKWKKQDTEKERCLTLLSDWARNVVPLLAASPGYRRWKNRASDWSASLTPYTVKNANQSAVKELESTVECLLFKHHNLSLSIALNSLAHRGSMGVTLLPDRFWLSRHNRSHDFPNSGAVFIAPQSGSSFGLPMCSDDWSSDNWHSIMTRTSTYPLLGVSRHFCHSTNLHEIYLWRTSPHLIKDRPSNSEMWTSPQTADTNIASEDNPLWEMYQTQSADLSVLDIQLTTVDNTDDTKLVRNHWRWRKSNAIHTNHHGTSECQCQYFKVCKFLACSWGWKTHDSDYVLQSRPEA